MLKRPQSNAQRRWMGPCLGEGTSLTSERGLVFPVVLMLVAMFMVASTSMLVRSVSETGLSVRVGQQTAAFHVAEAGIDQAARNLRSPTDFTDDVSTRTLPTGTFTLGPVESLGSFRYKVLSHGSSAKDPSSQRYIEAVFQLIPQSVFQFPLFGDEGITVSGGVITDSFDSALGSYAAQTPGDQGDIGSNCTTTGCVTVSGSIGINGQVAVGPGVADPASVVTGSGSALITGTPPVISQPEAFPMPTVTVPLGLTCTDYSVSGQEILTLSSAVGNYCFNNFSVSGGGTVAVNGPVVVYVTSQFSAGGNTTIGSTTNPKNLILIFTSTQTGALGSISGTTVFGGAIYAPSGGVNVSGDAVIYGSVVANSVTISSNAQVHYDTSLSQVTTVSGGLTPSLVSWREVE